MAFFKTQLTHGLCPSSTFGGISCSTSSGGSGTFAPAINLSFDLCPTISLGTLSCSLVGSNIHCLIPSFWTRTLTNPNRFIARPTWTLFSSTYWAGTFNHPITTSAIVNSFGRLVGSISAQQLQIASAKFPPRNLRLAMFSASSVDFLSKCHDSPALNLTTASAHIWSRSRVSAGRSNHSHTTGLYLRLPVSSRRYVGSFVVPA